MRLYSIVLQEEEDRKVETLRISKTSDEITVTSDPDKSEKIEKAVPFSFIDDPGSNNSGYYELQVNL